MRCNRLNHSGISPFFLFVVAINPKIKTTIGNQSNRNNILPVSVLNDLTLYIEIVSRYFRYSYGKSWSEAPLRMSEMYRADGCGWGFSRGTRVPNDLHIILFVLVVRSFNGLTATSSSMYPPLRPPSLKRSRSYSSLVRRYAIPMTSGSFSLRRRRILEKAGS